MELCRCCKKLHKKIPLLSPWEQEVTEVIHLPDDMVDEIGNSSLTWFEDMTDSVVQETASKVNSENAWSLSHDASADFWSPCPRGGTVIVNGLESPDDSKGLTSDNLQSSSFNSSDILLYSPVSRSRTSLENLAVNQSDVAWTSAMATPGTAMDEVVGCLNESDWREKPTASDITPQTSGAFIADVGQRKTLHRKLFSPGQPLAKDDSLTQALDEADESDITIREEEPDDTLSCIIADGGLDLVGEKDMAATENSWLGQPLKEFDCAPFKLGFTTLSRSQCLSLDVGQERMTGTRSVDDTQGKDVDATRNNFGMLCKESETQSECVQRKKDEIQMINKFTTSDKGNNKNGKEVKSLFISDLKDNKKQIDSCRVALEELGVMKGIPRNNHISNVLSALFSSSESSQEDDLNQELRKCENMAVSNLDQELDGASQSYSNRNLQFSETEINMETNTKIEKTVGMRMKAERNFKDLKDIDQEKEEEMLNENSQREEKEKTMLDKDIKGEEKEGEMLDKDSQGEEKEGEMMDKDSQGDQECLAAVMVSAGHEDRHWWSEASAEFKVTEKRLILKENSNMKEPKGCNVVNDKLLKESDVSSLKPALNVDWNTSQKTQSSATRLSNGSLSNHDKHQSSKFSTSTVHHSGNTSLPPAAGRVLSILKMPDTPKPAVKKKVRFSPQISDPDVSFHPKYTIGKRELCQNNCEMNSYDKNVQPQATSVKEKSPVSVTDVNSYVVKKTENSLSYANRAAALSSTHEFSHENENRDNIHCSKSANVLSSSAQLNSQQACLQEEDQLFSSQVEDYFDSAAEVEGTLCTKSRSHPEAVIDSLSNLKSVLPTSQSEGCGHDGTSSHFQLAKGVVGNEKLIYSSDCEDVTFRLSPMFSSPSLNGSKIVKFEQAGARELFSHSSDEICDPIEENNNDDEDIDEEDDKNIYLAAMMAESAEIGSRDKSAKERMSQMRSNGGDKVDSDSDIEMIEAYPDDAIKMNLEKGKHVSHHEDNSIFSHATSNPAMKKVSDKEKLSHLKTTDPSILDSKCSSLNIACLSHCPSASSEQPPKAESNLRSNLPREIASCMSVDPDCKKSNATFSKRRKFLYPSKEQISTISSTSDRRENFALVQQKSPSVSSSSHVPASTAGSTAGKKDDADLVSDCMKHLGIQEKTVIVPGQNRDIEGSMENLLPSKPCQSISGTRVCDKTSSCHTDLSEGCESDKPSAGDSIDGTFTCQLKDSISTEADGAENKHLISNAQNSCEVSMPQNPAEKEDFGFAKFSDMFPNGDGGDESTRMEDVHQLEIKGNSGEDFSHPGETHKCPSSSSTSEDCLFKQENQSSHETKDRMHSTELDKVKEKDMTAPSVDNEKQELAEDLDFPSQIWEMTEFSQMMPSVLSCDRNKSELTIDTHVSSLTLDAVDDAGDNEILNVKGIESESFEPNGSRYDVSQEKPLLMVPLLPGSTGKDDQSLAINADSKFEEEFGKILSKRKLTLCEGKATFRVPFKRRKITTASGTLPAEMAKPSQNSASKLQHFERLFLSEEKSGVFSMPVEENHASIRPVSEPAMQSHVSHEETDLNKNAKFYQTQSNDSRSDCLKHLGGKISLESSESFSADLSNPCVGFSTASGKAISVSEKAKEKAGAILADVDNAGADFASTDSKFCLDGNLPDFPEFEKKLLQFQGQASHGKGKPEGRRPSSASSCRDLDDGITGFSSAAGKKISLSHVSKEKAKKLWESTKERMDFERTDSRDMIKTSSTCPMTCAVGSRVPTFPATGKNVAVRTENKTNESDDKNQMMLDKKHQGFRPFKPPKLLQKMEVAAIKMNGGNKTVFCDDKEGKLEKDGVEGGQTKKSNLHLQENKEMAFPDHVTREKEVKVKDVASQMSMSDSILEVEMLNKNSNDNMTVKEGFHEETEESFLHADKGDDKAHFTSSRSQANANLLEPFCVSAVGMAEVKGGLQKLKASVDEVKSKNNGCLDKQSAANFSGFSMASDSMINVSEKAVNLAKSFWADDSLLVQENKWNKNRAEDMAEISGICVTSGCEAHVSKQALSLAQTNLTDEKSDRERLELESRKECDKDNSKTGDGALNNMHIAIIASGFSTASGSDVNVSKNVLKHAKTIVSGELDKRDIINDTETFKDFPKFAVASGSKVSVSKNALKHAKNVFNETINKSETTTNFPGFSTASGSKVCVSENALKHAKNVFNDDLDKCDTQVMSRFETMPSFLGFSTASGSKVNVSENSLKHAKENVFNEELHKYDTLAMNRSETTTNFPGFSTATGSKVNVSENALKHAKNIFNEDLDKCDTPTIARSEAVKDFPGFSTASGSKVNVSENALKHAKNVFNGDLDKCDTPAITRSETMTNFPGFSTASGSKVNVSENALKHAKNVFNEDLDKCDTPTITRSETMTNFPGFSTASGSKVNVSENALKHADTFFNEDLCKSDTDTSLHVQTVTNFPEFATASGSRVNVFEKALSLSNLLFESESQEKSSSKHNSNEASLTSSKMPGSLTTSKSKLKVKRRNASNCAKYDKDLAKSLMVEDDNPNIGRALHNFPSFSMASGQRVAVSDEALQYADKFFDGNDASLNNVEQFSSNASKSMNTGKVSETETTLSKDTSEFHQNKQAGRQKDHQSKNTLSRSFKVPLMTNSEEHLNDRHWTPGSGTRLKAMKSRVLPLGNRDTEPHERTTCNPSGEKLEINSDKILPPMDSKDSMPRKTSASFVPPPSTSTILPKQLTEQTTGQIGAKKISKFPLFLPKGCPSEKVVENSFKCRKKRREAEDDVASGTSSKGHTEKCQGREGLQVMNSSSRENLSTYLNHSEEDKDAFCPENSLKTRDTGPTSNAHARPDHGKSNAVVECRDQETSLNSSCGDMELNDEEENRFLCENVIERFNCDLSSKALDQNLIPDGSHPVANSNVPEVDSSAFALNVEEAQMKQEKLIRVKKRVKVSPLPGRWWENRAMHGNVTPMENVTGEVKSYSRQELISLGISESTLNISSQSAMDFRFDLKRFFPSLTAGILLGDGAFLIPDSHGFAGASEFYRAFLTLDGVDPNLVDELWLQNHYRWVVWKLAAYEVCYPSLFGNRCLTPDVTMLQLKYRYDKEIDKCQRSAIRKVVERDDTACKRMVLCVSDIRKTTNHQIVLEVTDGWYSIAANIDSPLRDLVERKKIVIGQKLVTSGAELEGIQDGCPPLEIPDSACLKLNFNATRPADAQARLGYCAVPLALCVPLASLHPDGGTVGCVDIVVTRKYPLMYMEKTADKGSIFRTTEEEDLAHRREEECRQNRVEKMYAEIQKEMEGQQEHRKKQAHCKWSRKEIQQLSTGADLAEALDSAMNPEEFEQSLSESQVNKLMDQKRIQVQCRQEEINSKLKEAMADTTLARRKVTTVQKFRVVGCSSYDIDRKCGCVLTVWRPDGEWQDVAEGRRYRIFNLSVSHSRQHTSSKCQVSLTANRQTRIQPRNIHESLLDFVYEAREVSSVSEIKEKCCDQQIMEFDFVGVAVTVCPAKQSGHPHVIHAADCHGDILSIKFWPSVPHSPPLVKELDCFVATSLSLRGHSGVRNPTVLLTADGRPEFTTFSTSCHIPNHAKVLSDLQELCKNPKFLSTARCRLESCLKNSSSRPMQMHRIASEVYQEDFPQEIMEKIFCPMSSQDVDDSIVVEKPDRPGNCNAPQITSCSALNRTPVSSRRRLNADPSGTFTMPNGQPDSSTKRKASPTLEDSVIKRKKKALHERMGRLLTYGRPAPLSPLPHNAVSPSCGKNFKSPNQTLKL